MNTELLDTTVTARHAPLGVLLWPVIGPEYARNFTLADVATEGGVTTWTYQNGKTRTFEADEEVVVRINPDDYPAVAASRARGLLDAPPVPAQAASTHYADCTAERPTRTARPARRSHIVGATS